MVFAEAGARDQTSQKTFAPVTPSATAATVKFAPNVGETALEIGETRQGESYRTKLIRIRYPYPPGQYFKPQKGNQFFGLYVRQCLRPDVRIGRQKPYSTYNGEWYIVSPGGIQATSSSSWNNFPTPKFPENVTLTPGECFVGWMTVEVPIGMKVAKIVFRAGGVTAAEWLP